MTPEGRLRHEAEVLASRLPDDEPAGEYARGVAEALAWVLGGPRPVLPVWCQGCEGAGGWRSFTDTPDGECQRCGGTGVEP